MNVWFSTYIPVIASQIVDFVGSAPIIYFVGLWMFLFVITFVRDLFKLGSYFGSL